MATNNYTPNKPLFMKTNIIQRLKPLRSVSFNEQKKIRKSRYQTGDCWVTSTVFVTVIPGLPTTVRENDSLVAMAFVSVKISR